MSTHNPPNTDHTFVLAPEQMTDNTQTFAFPEHAADAIEARLRGVVTPNIDRARREKPLVRMVDENDRPMIKVEAPTVTPKTSADQYSLDLPSRFSYYDFKDVYGTPLRVPHIAKIAKAHETRDLQMQVEAVSSVLSTPGGDKNIAMQLTMADYVSVLYWLRMVSYPKQQMRHYSRCDNEQHLADVEAGRKTQESLKIETVVLASDMKTKYLDNIPDPEEYSVTVDGILIPFGPETLGDTIEFLSHAHWADEEFQYKSRIAAVLKLEKATGRKWTWDQRIQFVDEFMTPYDAVKALEFADIMDDYGVIETIETQCKGCGSKGVSQLSADPLMFLQPRF